MLLLCGLLFFYCFILFQEVCGLGLETGLVFALMVLWFITITAVALHMANKASKGLLQRKDDRSDEIPFVLITLVYLILIGCVKFFV